MEDSEYDEDKKVSITSQPIFWVAMALVVFNVFLFLWSMNQKSGESADSESVEEVQEAASSVSK